MQRPNLTNSRHTSTSGNIRTRIGAAVVAGVAGALILGASAGTGQAAPDRGTASDTTVSIATSTAVFSQVTTGKATTRKRDVARAGKATARERRNARAEIRRGVAKLAQRQVGDSYAAGAEGPDAFDCSGLTLFAWKSAGVQLTHYSAGQYQQVKRIRPEAAMPGDLVFYLSRGARHVGVYVGDGMLVHASDYGVGVIKTPVRGTPWTNTHFTGFGRVTIPEDAIKETVKEIRQRRGRA